MMDITEREVSCQTAMKQKAFAAQYLGIIPYQTALSLQERLMQARAEGAVPDTLLLLQHPPVITIGRFRGEEEIMAPPDLLRQQGIDIVHTSRGGSVTYHGPGQLIGYPIIHLKENHLGVRAYLWQLEEVIITLLHTLGIEGHRRPEYLSGVWVGEKKVCSIGIRVNHHVTMHGFALNVGSNLDHFDYINPCGIKSNVMASLSRILDKPVEVEAVIEELIASFSEVFGLECGRELNHVQI